METNWPETVDELVAECRRLIRKNDLYTLGEQGEPYTGEIEPRVDGTEYLAGEYRYGVAMIPAQWVTHVIDAATLGGGKLTAEQVRDAIFDGSVYASYDGTQYYANGINMQAVADTLNAVILDAMTEYRSLPIKVPNTITVPCTYPQTTPYVKPIVTCEVGE